MFCHGYLGLNVTDLHAGIGSGTREGRLCWSEYLLVREKVGLYGVGFGLPVLRLSPSV